MKKNILFIIIYFIMFFILTCILGLNVKTEFNETMAYVLFGNLLYIFFGSIGWILIIWVASIIEKHPVGIRFVGGLIVLNILMFIAGGDVPLFALLRFDISNPNFTEGVLFYTIYIISFFIAAMVYKKEKI